MPWTTNEKIPGQKSKNSPAMAEFQGELHMVHAGDSSNAIWHTVFNGSWSENKPILDQLSKAPSALAAFQNRLHITHLGNSSNRIWHSSFDGTRWTTNEPIEGELSQAAPAMAVFQNALHLLHIGNSSHRIYHLVFDGVEWQRRPDNEGLEDQRSKGPVALAAFNGELHMVHQGDTSNRLWYTPLRRQPLDGERDHPGSVEQVRAGPGHAERIAAPAPSGRQLEPDLALHVRRHVCGRHPAVRREHSHPIPVEQGGSRPGGVRKPPPYDPPRRLVERHLVQLVGRRARPAAGSPRRDRGSRRTALGCVLQTFENRP